MGTKKSTVKNDLWAYRKKMGLSQKRTAYFMSLKKTNNLSRYEHGAKLPGLINALKLEIVYRTPVAFLFKEIYLRLKKEIRKREERLKTKEGQEKSKPNEGI
ncbi:MAG: helix-turn-helix transcriptional regulator [Thermodesulfobacteriota bacterium]|jgi:transcriptional regulator with XRE-family HTH domain|nr:MAG: helix-turn-helix transcriptional regulator [Thermodesulfobacteriota bacterium]